jgi:hypothetical protein
MRILEAPTESNFNYCFLSYLPYVGLLGLTTIFLNKKPYISKKQEEEAEKLGGSCIDDWWEFKEKNRGNKPSCDKGGHKERSIANQPNHLKHWKKQEK